MSLENDGHYIVYYNGEGVENTINFTLKLSGITSNSKLFVFFSNSLQITDCSEEVLKTSGGNISNLNSNKDIQFSVKGKDAWPLMFIYLCPNWITAVGNTRGEVIRVPIRTE